MVEEMFDFSNSDFDSILQNNETKKLNMRSNGGQINTSNVNFNSNDMAKLENMANPSNLQETPNANQRENSGSNSNDNFGSINMKGSFSNFNSSPDDFSPHGSLIADSLFDQDDYYGLQISPSGEGSNLFSWTGNKAEAFSVGHPNMNGASSPLKPTQKLPEMPASALRTPEASSPVDKRKIAVFDPKSRPPRKGVSFSDTESIETGTESAVNDVDTYSNKGNLKQGIFSPKDEGSNPFDQRRTPQKEVTGGQKVYLTKEAISQLDSQGRYSNSDDSLLQEQHSQQQQVRKNISSLDPRQQNESPTQSKPNFGSRGSSLAVAHARTSSSSDISLTNTPQFANSPSPNGMRSSSGETAMHARSRSSEGTGSPISPLYESRAAGKFRGPPYSGKPLAVQNVAKTPVSPLSKSAPSSPATSPFHQMPTKIPPVTSQMADREAQTDLNQTHEDSKELTEQMKAMQASFQEQLMNSSAYVKNLQASMQHQSALADEKVRNLEMAYEQQANNSKEKIEKLQSALKDLAISSERTVKSLEAAIGERDHQNRIMEKTLESQSQDSADNVKMKEYIAHLEEQLSVRAQESQEQKLLLQEQKRGFDKLSAQAYKKIKRLITEKSILSIEIKSMRSQMDRTQEQFEEWQLEL